jgi:DNA-directed RNA polymerase specialized sigma subunit
VSEATDKMREEISSLSRYNEFIKQYRNQREIAQHFGVSPTAVSKWHLKLVIRERVEKRLAK